MKNLATTKMSSKGQVVIPEDIRNRLKLTTGSRFVVVGNNDVIILKAIQPPSMDEFNDLLKEARKKAKKARLKRSDISDAVGQVRHQNKWESYWIQMFLFRVYFSAVRRTKYLKAWREGRLVLVVSPDILEEYYRVGENLSKRYTEVDITPVLEFVTINAFIDKS
jgi:AbrB family looped-hinge helix DNA binding protein